MTIQEMELNGRRRRRSGERRMGRSRRRDDDIRSGRDYWAEIWSAKTLVAGQALSLKFFDGVAEALGQSYNFTGSNPFETGRGAVMALKIKLLGPGGVPVDWTAVGMLNAYSQLIEASLYEILRNSLPQRRGEAASVFPPTPMVVAGFPVIDPSGSISGSGSQYKSTFKKSIQYKSMKSVFGFELWSASAFTIPAVLNNHIIKVSLAVVNDPEDVE